jgi:hydrogenase maturation protease
MKESNPKKGLLLIGIGNEGRADDGLGWAFLDQLEGQPGFDREYRYQLQIEDADLIAGYQEVLFIDATLKQQEEGFEVERCEAKGDYTFSTHALSPQTLLEITQSLYAHCPQAQLLTIAGSSWGLKQGLSEEASQNLHQALAFFKSGFAPAFS